MRRAIVVITIKGKECTNLLSPYLTSLSYTDKSDDELDDLQIVLEDRDRLFQSAWMPEKGDKISAKIIVMQWQNIADFSMLDCGEFECDEIELSSNFDGGDIITIKAVPAVVSSSLMNEQKTRAWEKASMAEVVGDVAGEAGLDTLYKAPEIIFERVEQREESDMAFLQRICKEQGLRLCLKKNQIVVYMGQQADASDTILISRLFAGVDNFRFKTKMEDIYTECVVGYSDPETSEEKTGDFKPEEPPKTGKTLTINQRVEDPAQAERIATAALRDKNSQEITGSFSGMGDTRMVAGCVVLLSGWGKFDTKYVIKEARHNVAFDGGYTVDVDLEKALDY